ncbi:DUF4258 domain-containing protein [Caldibacillus thermoamylovorans]|uniref:DUF4258 domain-containing protein n=1 Tax=Caldibacillus thermoamylovorans TaxID=35841 RepID=A0ABD4AB62_9BACI|nr:DUF4258 domain-containing protein [Caldibacillus thermoamylovorans]KIO66928.1 hypothetical protein B4166_2473 [Caldibacillus thermoamylovorans]KIO73902.1 hypothetical protein B4167_1735 [Caldibacillus thermoamylovorans]
MISIETLVCKDEEECQRKRERWEHLQNRFCAIGQRELDMFRARMGDGKHKILCDKHFYKRSFERSISEADFKEVLKCGWVVERNKTAKATSIMLLGYVGRNYRPLHIVIDMVSENLWVAVTAYNPQSHAWKWNEGFDKRVGFCNPYD